MVRRGVAQVPDNARAREYRGAAEFRPSGHRPAGGARLRRRIWAPRRGLLSPRGRLAPRGLLALRGLAARPVQARRTWRRAGLAGVLAAAALAAACSSSAPTPAAGGSGSAPAPAAPPVGPHPGVNLNVLVLTDGSPAVQAISAQLGREGVPDTVISLRGARRTVITSAFLSRSLPGGGRGGNFDGVVLPGPDPAGLTGAEQAALAAYERDFGVRQVDAYAPPQASLGMSAPVYAGPLRGAVTVTAAGSRAGFGYLNATFPFSGGAAGPAPFGYLARPLAGAGVTPLLDAALPGGGTATLAWQFAAGGREQLGVGFGYAGDQAQSRYLGPGIVAWLTRGVYAGYWRSYLTVDYDDVINADAQWSITGHCTPGAGACPRGTPKTAPIRMTPADVSYAVRWQRQHHFTMEFLFNGGPSAQFRVHGTDPLLAAFRPVAADFFWINHTFSHANLGCRATYTATSFRCVRSGGRIVWDASRATVDSQIQDNLAWARANGIPVVPGVLATGEYSGLRLLPQQPADNPALIAATGPNKIRWIALDASRDPDMRPVGAALGVPRHPIDIGYDVDSVAEEVSEFNWYHSSKRDGGSGLCQTSTTTACERPLSPRTGWSAVILPEQVQIVLHDLLGNDPRPFFLHQSNLTGGRLGYPVMSGVLAAYRAVYAAGAPVVNLPMSGDGEALRRQSVWAGSLRAGSVTAWVQDRDLIISGPPGTLVPVTAPPGTRTGVAAGPEFGAAYGAARSAWVRLGDHPVRLALPSAPFRQPG
jgi:hypothetical protein